MTARWPILAALLATIVAGGLALFPPGPRLNFHSLADPHRADSWVPFRLTDSIVLIGTPGATPATPISLTPGPTTCPGNVCGVPVNAAAIPADDTSAVWAMEPVGRWLVSTRLAPVYLPDSLRLKTLAIEVADHRQEAINTIGSIAAGARALASGGGDAARSVDTVRAPALQLKLPITLDLAWLKKATGFTDLPDGSGWMAMARFTDDPPRSGFIPRRDIGRVHAAAVSSTCRPLTIKLSQDYGQSTALTFTVRVADPDWLTPTPLPSKGAVLFQPMCGADIQAEKSVTVGADALAQSFFAQVQAVRAAGSPLKK